MVADTAAQGDEGTAAQGDEGAEEETDHRGGPRPIVSCAGVERARDPYRIRSRTVDGDVLTVVVTHSTGCRPHEFRLCYEPELLDTDPVQVNLRLDHDAHGERCQAIGRKVLEVDLGPLRDHYLAAHPNGESMVLNLGEPITYEL